MIAVPDSRNIAVSCRNVVKHYGSGASRVTALRGIDLDVYRGEMLMVVGPSGCGKTTLISIISTLLDQDSGSCQVLGRDLSQLRSAEREGFRRNSIGFVFQLFNLLPALSAVENVAVPLLLAGVPSGAALQRARAVIDSVGLTSRADAPPSQLSGGQQQRVAIARALVHEPSLIVCDEPTSSLDHQSGQAMMGLLRDIADTPDRSLVIVTHDPRILPFADRIAHMDDGRIVEVNRTASEDETL